MSRKLFCEISPLTYAISVKKMRFLRRVKGLLSGATFAGQKGDAHFVLVGDQYYRRDRIVRNVVDKRTGDTRTSEVIKQSNARVLYDAAQIDKTLLRTEQEP